MTPTCVKTCCLSTRLGSSRSHRPSLVRLRTNSKSGLSTCTETYMWSVCQYPPVRTFSIDLAWLNTTPIKLVYRIWQTQIASHKIATNNVAYKVNLANTNLSCDPQNKHLLFSVWPFEAGMRRGIQTSAHSSPTTTRGLGMSLCDFTKQLKARENQK